MEMPNKFALTLLLVLLGLATSVLCQEGKEYVVANFCTGVGNTSSNCQGNCSTYYFQSGSCNPLGLSLQCNHYDSCFSGMLYDGSGCSGSPKLTTTQPCDTCTLGSLMVNSTLQVCNHSTNTVIGLLCLNPDECEQCEQATGVVNLGQCTNFPVLGLVPMSLALENSFMSPCNLITITGTNDATCLQPLFQEYSPSYVCTSVGKYSINFHCVTLEEPEEADMVFAKRGITAMPAGLMAQVKEHFYERHEMKKALGL